MSCYFDSNTTAISSVSPPDCDKTPCILRIVHYIPANVLYPNCLSIVRYMVENHPDIHSEADNCLRSCSKYIRPDIDSISRFNRLLPNGWKMLAAPSPASVIHRRRRQRKMEKLESLGHQCRSLILKVQQRFKNADGTNGPVTMTLLHPLNGQGDRQELRQKVRALFQWHHDLLHDFDEIFCPAAQPLEDVSVPSSPADGESRLSNASLYRTPSPAPSLSISGDKTAYSGSPATPASSSSRHRSAQPDDPFLAGAFNQSKDAFYSSFIFTPPSSSPRGLSLGLNDARDSPDVPVTAISPNSLMDRYLIDSRKTPEHSFQSQFSVSQGQTVAPPPQPDLFLFSTAPPQTQHLNQNVLPKYAPLDKQFQVQKNMHSYETTATPTAAHPAVNSLPSAYAPVLYPFDVAQGRQITFDSPSDTIAGTPTRTDSNSFPISSPSELGLTTKLDQPKPAVQPSDTRRSALPGPKAKRKRRNDLIGPSVALAPMYPSARLILAW